MITVGVSRRHRCLSFKHPSPPQTNCPGTPLRDGPPNKLGIAAAHPIHRNTPSYQFPTPCP